MGKTILKTLTNNLGFKLLAVFFAIILWLVVYNVDDPVVTRTYSTSVSMVNQDTIQDKYFEILDNTNTVEFSVSAKRSVLDKIDDGDFSASADFNDLVVDSTGTKGSIKIEIVAKRNSSALKFNGTSRYLQVSIEDAKSKQFVVTAAAAGTVAEGYALGDVAISSSNVIKVSGPATTVAKISKVIASINVEGMSQNLSDSVVPILYDEDGNEIDTTKLSLSRTTVTVSAVILATKKINLNFSTTGIPAEGYALSGITADKYSVWIKGATSNINPVNSIEIPGNILDITNATSNLDTTINITEYLPSGVSLLNSADATVSVVVEIEAYENRIVGIPIENITIEGLAPENELVYPQGIVYVSITGLSSDLDALDTSLIRGNIDVTDMTLGSHAAVVELEIDASKYIVTSAKTQVNIITKTEENADDPENAGDGLQNPDNSGGVQPGQTDNQEGLPINPETDDSVEGEPESNMSSFYNN